MENVEISWKFFRDIHFFLQSFVTCTQRPNDVLARLDSALLYSPYLCISTEKYLARGTWCYSVWYLVVRGSEKSSPVLSDTHCRHCVVQVIVTVSLLHQRWPVREQTEQHNLSGFKHLGICCGHVLCSPFVLVFLCCNGSQEVHAMVFWVVANLPHVADNRAVSRHVQKVLFLQFPPKKV